MVGILSLKLGFSVFSTVNDFRLLIFEHFYQKHIIRIFEVVNSLGMIEVVINI